MSTRPPKPVRDALDLIRPTAMLLSIVNDEAEHGSRRDPLGLGLPIGITVELDHDLANAALIEQLARRLHSESVSPTDAIAAADREVDALDQFYTRAALLEAIESSSDDRVMSGSLPRAVSSEDARGARFGAPADPAPHATTPDPDSQNPAHAPDPATDSRK